MDKELKQLVGRLEDIAIKFRQLFFQENPECIKNDHKAKILLVGQADQKPVSMRVKQQPEMKT